MLQGPEKAHRRAELPRAATKAPPEAERPPRGVARLPTSHPLAGPPLLALQAAARPAAHWALAARDPGAAHLRADRREAAPPAAALPRAVPAADRAVVHQAIAHPAAAHRAAARQAAVVPPASNRRVRSQKVISAVALRLSLLGSSLSDRQSALQQEVRGLHCCSVHLQALKYFLSIEQLAGVAFELGGPARRGMFREDPPARSLTDEFTLLRA
jgi:hypothetical protein